MCYLQQIVPGMKWFMYLSYFQGVSVSLYQGRAGVFYLLRQ